MCPSKLSGAASFTLGEEVETLGGCNNRDGGGDRRILKMRDLDVGESIDAPGKVMLKVVKLFHGGCHDCLGGNDV